MLPKFALRFRRPLVFAIHVALVPLAYWLAFGLRFDFRLPEEMWALFAKTLPWLFGLRVLSLALFGLFHGWWRHVGMRDVINLVKAVTLSSGVLLAALFFTGSLQGFPRSVLLLEWAAALFVLGGARFVVRALREDHLFPVHGRGGKPVLIIGAGLAAERLIRESQRDGCAQLDPVALVDDEATKLGMRIHGVPVIGGTDTLEEAIARSGAQMLVIAMPSADREDIKRIVDRCLASGVDFKIVPSLHEMLEGPMPVSQLRRVEVEDLLGRQRIDLDLTGPEGDLRGRRVLVTGAAGSIGSELARQIASFRPLRLVLLDQAESPLYFAHLELAASHPDLALVPIVADVTDDSRLENVFAEHRPEFVFHAAAYKHVPLMEANAVEAVRTNVLGTLRLAEVSARHGAERFVLISTDKAVHPSSVMGASKAVAEQVVLGWPALREARTDFRAVRFGNVLGSEGSVIPVFRKQLAAGQPLTVTHPEVTRYFMTIPEAVQLVLQAASLPESRARICMLEMGEPVRIVELAENLIRLSGLEPYRDVPIVFTGLRPGEKLHEELTADCETTTGTTVPKVRLVSAERPNPDELTSGMDRLVAAAAVGARADVVDALRQLVPECRAPLREPGAVGIEGD